MYGRRSESGGRSGCRVRKAAAQTKKPQSISTLRLVVLVRLAGIEPTTPWFVAKYSIQLSYSRQASNYSTTILLFLENFQKIQNLLVSAEQIQTFVSVDCNPNKHPHWVNPDIL